MRLSLLSGALLLATVSGAAAQSFGSLTSPGSAYDWSGLYLGTQVGWG